MRFYTYRFAVGGKPSTRLLGDYMLPYKWTHEWRLYIYRFGTGGKPSTRLLGDYMPAEK